MNELAGCHPAHSPQAQAPVAYPPTYKAMNFKPRNAIQQHAPSQKSYGAHMPSPSISFARKARSPSPASASSHRLPPKPSRGTVKISPDYRQAVQTVGVVALAHHIKRELVDSWVDLPLSSPGKIVDVQARHSLSNRECERWQRSRARPYRSRSPRSRATSPSAPSCGSSVSQSPQRPHSRQHWLYSAARSCVGHQQQPQRQLRPKVHVQEDDERKQRPRSKTQAPPLRKSSFHKHQAYNRPRSPSQPQPRRRDSGDDFALPSCPRQQQQQDEEAEQRLQAEEKEEVLRVSPSSHFERQLSRPMTPPPRSSSPSSVLVTNAGKKRAARSSSTGTTDSALTATPGTIPEPVSTPDDMVDKVVEAMRSALLKQVQDDPESLASLLQARQQPCRKQPLRGVSTSSRPSSRDSIHLPRLKTGADSSASASGPDAVFPLELALPSLNLRMRAVFSNLQTQTPSEAPADSKYQTPSASLEGDGESKAKAHRQ